MFDLAGEFLQLSDGQSEHIPLEPAAPAARDLTEKQLNVSSSVCQLLPALEISTHKVMEQDAKFRPLAKRKEWQEMHRYLSAGNVPCLDEVDKESTAHNYWRKSETRSILVSELAFAVMISLAGAARRRPDIDLRITDSDSDEGKTPRDPQRLHFEQSEQQGASHKSSLNVDKFSWVKIQRPCAVANNGIAFDGTSFLPENHEQRSVSDLQSSLAAASVFSWWRKQTDERKQANDLANQDSRQAPESMPVFRNRPTLIVGMTDTLSEIAEELFHDPGVAWLIADLNKGASREYWIDGKRIVRLKHRQQIILPIWSDIVEFDKVRPEISRSARIVTIVEETRIDIDLIEATLAGVMGGAVEPTT